jgi:hypothetical protein
MARLSASEQHILRCIKTGYALKAHRYLDGAKLFKLHALDGGSESVPRVTIERLAQRGLIDSNKKFPVASFWLTERGKLASAELTND